MAATGLVSVLAALFLEYEDVLMRPETRLATKMDAADLEGFLAAFASAAEGVQVNRSSVLRLARRLPPPNGDV